MSSRRVQPEEILDSDLFDVREHAPNAYEPTESSRRSRPPPLPPAPPPQRSSGFQRNAAGDPFSARPGELLASKYVIEQPPVRSGGVLVFQVRHADLGQRFVLKCLIPEACGDPDAVAKFLRGARAAIHLTSEHTARTVDAGRFPSNAPYIVSEALNGCDLRETLRVRGVLAPSEAVDLILQACEAVAEAHSNGLVHRNLNLTTLFAMRRPGGSSFIKVMDFGIADVLAGDPARNETYLQFSSTPYPSNQAGDAIRCYSPEQIRGLKDIDVRTDVWALGAILHELLAGSPLYPAVSVPSLLAMIVADPPVPVTSVRSDVPSGLEAVILRCLEKERSARFPSVADFAVALRSFASPEARGSIERITRTLAQGRSTMPPVSSSALVHVPSPELEATRQAPAAPPPALPPPAAPAPSHSSLLLVAAIIALGQVGGMVAAVFIARMPAAPQVTTASESLVTDVSRAIAAEGEVAANYPRERVVERGPAVLPQTALPPLQAPAQPVAAPVVTPAPVAPALTPVVAPRLATPRPAATRDAHVEAPLRAQAPRARVANDAVAERAAAVRPDLFDSVQ
jgi:serine/threonine protein kinase